MAEYSDVDRVMALDIYKNSGATAAAKATGCSRQTIYDWLADSLSTDTDKERAAKEATDRRTVLREHGRTRLVYTYLRLIDRCTESFKVITKEGVEIELSEPPADAVQKLALAAAILIDKLRLELGEATGRTESWSMANLDAEAQRLEALLASNDPRS